MPVPFISKHSESQYLKVETGFINLFNFLQSLLTITEGEDLSSDSQRLIHFNALCKRINEGLIKFNKIAEQVQGNKFIGNSASSLNYPESAEVAIYCDKKEHKLIVESIENYSLMLGEYKISNQLNQLAKQIKELKNESN